MKTERIKEYIKVNADHTTDGRCHPNSITFENGDRYEIDRVIQVCRAASTKVGGTGIRYTIMVSGHRTYLFDEEDGRWFVEAKTGGAG